MWINGEEKREEAVASRSEDTGEIEKHAPAFKSTIGLDAIGMN